MSDINKDTILERLASVKRRNATLKSNLNDFMMAKTRDEFLYQTNHASIDLVMSGTSGNVYWLDRQSNFIGCNKQFSDILKISSPNEIYGKTYFDFMDPKSAKVVVATNMEIMKSNQESSLQEIGYDINGNEAIYFSKKLPVHNCLGEVIGLLGISIDITARVHNEAKIKRYNEQLKIANKEKSEFIMNMSHDIRTPCSGLIGFSKSLYESETDPDKKEQLRSILDSGEQLLFFLNDIISDVSVDDNTVRHEAELFQIRKLFDDIKNLFSAKLLQKKLPLTIDFSEDVPKQLLGNKSSFYRVILNLVSNAVKFTNQGYIKIKIDVIEKKNQSIILEICIDDTGIGINDEDKPYIFDRFYSVSDKAQSQNNGTGLFIIKQMLNVLGGTISLLSNEHHGSTFICKIPFEISEEPIQSVPHTESVNKVIELPIEAQALNVLLVEDNIISQEMAKFILSEHGCDVVTAATGEQALVLANDHFDLILMDIGLPDIDGLEVTKMIRDNSIVNKNTLIIGLTAHLDKRYREKAIDAGLDTVYLKPLTSEICLSLVNAYKNRGKKS